MKILFAFFLLHIFFINTHAMMSENISSEDMRVFRGPDNNLYITDKYGSYIRKCGAVISDPSTDICLLEVTSETPIATPIVDTEVTVINIMNRIINSCRSVEKEKEKEKEERGSGYVDISHPITLLLLLKKGLKHEVKISFDLCETFSKIDICTDSNITDSKYDKLRAHAEEAVQAYEAR